MTTVLQGNSRDISFERFIENLMMNAYRSGLSSTTVVSVPVLGISENYATPDTKRVTVSFTSNFELTGDYEEFWLNANNLILYRDDKRGGWLQVQSYAGIFTGDPAFNGDTATGPLYAAGNPQSPMELANKQYVDQVLAQAVAQLPISMPVNTLQDLRDLDLTNIQDGKVVLVDETKIVYTYDLQGTGVDDGEKVITPTSGVGRWFPTVNGVLDSGYF